MNQHRGEYFTCLWYRYKIMPQSGTLMSEVDAGSKLQSRIIRINTNQA